MLKRPVEIVSLMMSELAEEQMICRSVFHKSKNRVWGLLGQPRGLRTDKGVQRRTRLHLGLVVIH